MQFSKFYVNSVFHALDDHMKAVHVLSEWGCCARCVVRFIGEKEPSIYRKSIEDLDEWVQFNVQYEEQMDASDVPAPNAETKSEEGSENVCVTCLGILQDRFCSEKFLKEINDIVIEKDHEFKTYFCSISTPVLLCFRENAIWLCLKKIFPDVYIGAKTDDDIIPIKEVWKWINGQPLGHLIAHSYAAKSDFTIALNFVHPNSNNECSFLYDLYPSTFKQRKTSQPGYEVFTRANVTKALDDMQDDCFRRNYTCPPRRLPLPCDCDPITCVHESTFIAGRYNKYARNISQTPWNVDGNRKPIDSIEDVICKTANLYVKGKDYRFAASGREDVDVKMLGRGRPFAVEFTDPHKITFTKDEMADMQKEINSVNPGVRVRDLQVVFKEETSIIKSGEQEKTKRYSAICYADRDLTQEDIDKINSIKDLNLYQKTPIRVLHRRPLAIRERLVHSASASMMEDSTNHFRITLSTQAGTYIKEFVHSDFGRTSPNLGELLGCNCDILELNVEEVLLNWPNRINNR